MPTTEQHGREPQVTPDGRYIVVRGRLWRRADPGLAEAERQAFVAALMHARRAVGAALRAGDDQALALARSKVDAAKVSLGERGPVWWSDGSPDLNRRLVRNTPYADWFATQSDRDINTNVEVQARAAGGTDRCVS